MHALVYECSVSQKLTFSTYGIDSLFSIENYCRYTPTVPHIKYTSCELDYGNFSGDSNFLDLDWLSASDNGRLFILPCFPFLVLYLCLRMYQAFYLLHLYTCSHAHKMWQQRIIRLTFPVFLLLLFYIYH